MQLINQHTKKIMEGCKERALDAGLRFETETLEYIVTNIDMLELSPKHMIPTMYDFWLQDIQVLRGKGEYEYYPHNPYETVINTRPAISFYNDNNPDWLNVMIFYHVLGHIDFFQNNLFFEKTWDYDFKEKALTEKRMIAKLRSQKGRELEYVIEFAQSIDNLVGYFANINEIENEDLFGLDEKENFFFNEFLQKDKKMGMREFFDEIEKYNKLKDKGNTKKYFDNANKHYPEFEEKFRLFKSEKKKTKSIDVLQYIANESPFLQKPENTWIKSVLEIVRETSLYFGPQIRTKIMNEGWASYWHEKLFLADDRIHGHEVAFAKINAKVTSLSKVGLNPYAVGWRLFMHIEDMMNKGKYSMDFLRTLNIKSRKDYDKKLNTGKDFIFFVRESFNDSIFINQFVDQDFVDKYKLMVVGQRINAEKGVKEYYVKSRNARDYKSMIVDGLFHPPCIHFNKNLKDELILKHVFEGKEIYKDYIPNVLIGLEYLWGKKVQLETTEFDWDEMKKVFDKDDSIKEFDDVEPIFKEVIYTVENKKVTKRNLN